MEKIHENWHKQYNRVTSLFWTDLKVRSIGFLSNSIFQWPIKHIIGIINFISKKVLLFIRIDIEISHVSNRICNYYEL